MFVIVEELGLLKNKRKKWQLVIHGKVITIMFLEKQRMDKR